MWWSKLQPGKHAIVAISFEDKSPRPGCCFANPVTHRSLWAISCVPRAGVFDCLRLSSQTCPNELLPVGFTSFFCVCAWFLCPSIYVHPQNIHHVLVKPGHYKPKLCNTSFLYTYFFQRKCLIYIYIYIIYIYIYICIYIYAHMCVLFLIEGIGRPFLCRSHIITLKIEATNQTPKLPHAIFPNLLHGTSV